LSKTKKTKTEDSKDQDAVVRKFSFGGDAWNKKSNSKSKNSDVETIIDDEEDEGR